MSQLDDDEVAMVVKALEHYWTYLVATNRGDHRYKELADRLQRKAPTSEQAIEKPLKKQA